MATEKENYVSDPESHNSNNAAPAPLEMSTDRYLATRIPSLKPPMDRLQNPITLLRMLSGKHWAQFAVAFIVSRPRYKTTRRLPHGKPVLSPTPARHPFPQRRNTR